MKCKGCPSWETEKPGAAKYIVGLCRKCTLEVLADAALNSEPIIIRKDYVPPPRMRERRIRGVKLFWYKGKWRAE